MKLIPGSRLRSQVCSTEVIVVRGGDIDDELTCGGAPMVAFDADVSGGTPLVGLDTGTLVGKRYASDDGLELLATKAGAGTLGIGNAPLPVKGARSLPSSD